MGVPITIKEEDDEKLLRLKEQTKSKSKVDVIRKALSLLELDLAKKERIKRWRQAASIIGDSSLEVLEDFKTKNRFNDLP